MAYAVFSKFQKSEDQLFIYGEVIKEFQWLTTGSTAMPPGASFPNTSKKGYELMVENAVKTIKNTSLEKVVLSRKQSVVRRFDDLKTVEKLLDTYPLANCYFLYHPKVGRWMGATPETLLSYKNGVLKTMSLAGTKRGDNPEEIHWGIKEMEEQKLVTDFIVAALKSAGTQEVIAGEKEMVKAGNLFHLKTSITAKTHFQNLENCVRELHPTPAVCGLPRGKAYEYILKHENYDRSFYTGYLGWNDPVQQSADYFVNLRCMELHDDRIDLFAGGGITALSNPADEFEEVQNKLMTMASVL